MDVLLYLAIGLAAGVVARRVVPWKPSEPLGPSMTVGIMGTFAGAFVGHLMGYREGDPASFVTASLGALGLAFVYQALSGRRRAI